MYVFNRTPVTGYVVFFALVGIAIKLFLLTERETTLGLVEQRVIVVQNDTLSSDCGKDEVCVVAIEPSPIVVVRRINCAKGSELRLRLARTPPPNVRITIGEIDRELDSIEDVIHVYCVAENRPEIISWLNAIP